MWPRTKAIRSRRIIKLTHQACQTWWTKCPLVLLECTTPPRQLWWLGISTWVSLSSAPRCSTIRPSMACLLSLWEGSRFKLHSNFTVLLTTITTTAKSLTLSLILKMLKSPYRRKQRAAWASSRSSTCQLILRTRSHRPTKTSRLAWDHQRPLSRTMRTRRHSIKHLSIRTQQVSWALTLALTT